MPKTRQYQRSIAALAIVGAIFMTAAIGTAAAQAQTFRVLHSFNGYPVDGNEPSAGLIRDAAGNLYGTAYEGGPTGYGVVFMLDRTGKETLLQLYGGSGWLGAPRGCGVVFKIKP
jgi:uncharacterized repeat protein (TIGR03803 family)